MEKLKEEFNKTADSDQIEPQIVTRINQVFNDTIAAIPPDPKQEPALQRATMTSTMTKLKTQVSAVVDSLGAKKEVAEKLKSSVEQAETEAKEKDEKENVAQPSGPSQSPMDLQHAAQSEGVSTEQPVPTEEQQPEQSKEQQPEQECT